MAATLAEIRARLQAQDNRTGNTGTGGMDKSIYAHWNIDEGQSCLIRFLPDADPKNTFFWQERAMIRLPFSGVKGGENKSVIVQVPCMEMWGETCPVLTEVRPWYKDKSLEPMASKYWKKRSYLMQGFVRENPMEKDETPENPIRRFIFTPQLFGVIKAALLDPELEEMPTHYEKGLDFRVSKTTKGGYGDYTTSKWARKESSLTQLEHEAINKFGLFNLADFMPKKPTDVEVKVIKEMFEASVDGQPFDMDRWGQYFKPAGMSNSAFNAVSDDDSVERTATVPAPASVTTKTVDTEQAAPWNPPAAAPAETVSKPSAQANDILAMIRNRQKSV
jgi:hypothetical protein